MVHGFGGDELQLLKFTGERVRHSCCTFYRECFDGPIGEFVEFYNDIFAPELRVALSSECGLFKRFVREWFSDTDSDMLEMADLLECEAVEIFCKPCELNTVFLFTDRNIIEMDEFVETEFDEEYFSDLALEINIFYKCIAMFYKKYLELMVEQYKLYIGKDKVEQEKPNFDFNLTNFIDAHIYCLAAFTKYIFRGTVNDFVEFHNRVFLSKYREAAGLILAQDKFAKEFGYWVGDASRSRLLERSLVSTYCESIDASLVKRKQWEDQILLYDDDVVSVDEFVDEFKRNVNDLTKDTLWKAADGKVRQRLRETTGKFPRRTKEVAGFYARYYNKTNELPPIVDCELIDEWRGECIKQLAKPDYIYKKGANRFDQLCSNYLEKYISVLCKCYKAYNFESEEDKTDIKEKEE